MNVPEKKHPVLLKVTCRCRALSGSRQQRQPPRELFQLTEPTNFVSHRRTQTHCRGRRVQSPPSPFRRTIPGRHRDESKLCLTNTLVLFSLHGKLARTADIIRSKTIFFLNISLPLSLPPSQADVHSYSSVVYPIRVVRQLQSIWSFFCTL